jgi:hypothetical protein
MLDLLERFFPYAFTYILGLSVLGFCWARRQERLSFAAIVGRIFWLLVALFLLVVFPPIALVYLVYLPFLALSIGKRPRA